MNSSQTNFDLISTVHVQHRTEFNRQENLTSQSHSSQVTLM